MTGTQTLHDKYLYQVILACNLGVIFDKIFSQPIYLYIYIYINFRRSRDRLLHAYMSALCFIQFIFGSCYAVHINALSI